MHCSLCNAFCSTTPTYLANIHIWYLLLLLSMQHKESRKLKVILFEFLLHKCGEFEFAHLHMEFAAEYKKYMRYSLSHCAVACTGNQSNC